jgi:hypothetical protein
MTSIDNYWKSRLIKWTSLDPVDLLSEALFGFIMVLTFTCTISTSTAGRQEVSQLLWAALGCNLAWGLVDAIMNLMDSAVERRHDITLIRRIREEGLSAASRDVVRGNITPIVSELMEDREIDELVVRLKKLPDPDLKIALTFKDFLIAGRIFLIVFLSTFPVALPFLFITDVVIAMRVSNGVALLLMSVAGYFLGRYSGMKPVVTALTYTALGVFLVTLTIFLGG